MSQSYLFCSLPPPIPSIWNNLALLTVAEFEQLVAFRVAFVVDNLVTLANPDISVKEYYGPLSEDTCSGIPCLINIVLSLITITCDVSLSSADISINLEK